MKIINFASITVSYLAEYLGLPENQLRRLANTSAKFYTYSEVPKTSGGFRTISKPRNPLRSVQKNLHKLLQANSSPLPHSHYGLKQKSNLTNARIHKGCMKVYNCDLKDFFPSIRPERVFKSLCEEKNCPHEVAKIITKLVTNMHQLPQGASTSTDIVNIVTLRLQRRLNGLAQQWRLNFSIYADDITFSGEQISDDFVDRVKKIIKDEGFTIHPSKGGVFNKSLPQMVTGVNLAHGASAGRIKKEWRAEYHQQLTLYKEGIISLDEFEAAKLKFHCRLKYDDSIKKYVR
jgi:hypothetical protein